jgi:hypothetical protein
VVSRGVERREGAGEVPAVYQPDGEDVGGDAELAGVDAGVLDVAEELR